ncbi:MAG: exonuclease SbcCD subunit D [Ruminococcaceae bacterium]|nr:exonuclease SbcCD subunit D [Oscillospiraceae bacterium]
MKLFHLSDLHLGKRIHERSLLKDQEDILNRMIEAAAVEKPDAVMIAGDVYDRSVPSEEAVALFDELLFRLSELDISVLVISGNHDSAERLGFGGRIMERSGVFISPEFNSANYKRILQPVVLNDEFGEVNFYMLPYITPAAVRAARGGEISGWNEMAERVFADMDIDASKRNILIAHQFVTGASSCDSERVSVGGADNIDAYVFEAFDYVALGHIHGKQHIGRETLRYCGTPLKYSFSEVSHHKSITVVEVGEKGSVSISEIPLDKPLHDWREIKGKFSDITEQSSEDFVKVVLTDEEEIYNAIGKLREYFPNIMSLEYDNSRTRAEKAFVPTERFDKLSPAELFAEFYKQQRGTELNGEQLAIVNDIFTEITEETK